MVTNFDKFQLPSTISFVFSFIYLPRRSEASPPPRPQRRLPFLAPCCGPPSPAAALPVVGWGAGGGWGGGGWGSVSPLPPAWGSAVHSNGGWGENSAWLFDNSASAYVWSVDGTFSTSRVGRRVGPSRLRLARSVPGTNWEPTLLPAFKKPGPNFSPPPPAPPPQANHHGSWDNPAWDDYVRWMSAPVSYRMSSSSHT
ncbi:hypothetical protein C8R47DRAFT_1207229 [Mycena vitilis]|nr:hypothetical protein C8R47DRAFT_1207229 [Mycena vitilis]